ncbi:MAG: hypothetical protein IAE80_12745 [Anaerolinea sp.]|nr:hypothetical protein [Anaerolinea sp.]
MTTLLQPANWRQSRWNEWLPAIAAGLIAWIAFLVIGETPLLRASGMALAVVGMALALRSMGAALSIIGGLALAFSPSFWIQTGGAESLNPVEVIGALIGVAVVGFVAIRLGVRPSTGLALMLVIFEALFLAVIGTPRSLRMNTLLAAWTLFLLIDGLLISNPRPDSPPHGTMGLQHSLGLLILLGIGVLNDPMFTLMIPAIALGLFLTKQRLSPIYWMILASIAVFGVNSLLANYYAYDWWNFTADAAQQSGMRHIPFLIGDAWREPFRWIGLSELIVQQFTWIGLALGVLGLSRLARWHPAVGVVTMLLYGGYGLFGLSYFGEDRPVLLLPLLMIQIVWMTYAVYTFGQWLGKSLRAPDQRAGLLTAAVFTLLPLFMLLRIIGAR